MAGSDPGNEEANSLFYRVYHDKRLNVGVIVQIQEDTEIACARRCLRNQECQSFNFGPGRTCELANRKASSHLELITEQGCSYWEVRNP